MIVITLQTPLYLAVSSNTPEMVELLIQSGADVNLFAEVTIYSFLSARCWVCVCVCVCVMDRCVFACVCVRDMCM